MTQGWAKLAYTGVENHFWYSWCRTTGEFYLEYLRHRTVCKTTLQQGTYVDKAKAHKYLQWPQNIEEKGNHKSALLRLKICLCSLSWRRLFGISNFVIWSLSFFLFPLLSLPGQALFSLNSKPVCWSRWSRTSTSVTRGHGIVNVK